jgi:hypothetical protein
LACISRSIRPLWGLGGNEAWPVTGSMVDDVEAREAVRQLMRRFDPIAGQGSAMALVLAKRYPHEYARWRAAAEAALQTMIQPIRDAVAESGAVQAAR